MPTRLCAFTWGATRCGDIATDPSGLCDVHAAAFVPPELVKQARQARMNVRAETPAEVRYRIEAIKNEIRRMVYARAVNGRVKVPCISMDVNGATIDAGVLITFLGAYP